MMNNHQSEEYKKKKKILTYVLTAFISSLLTVGIILLVVFFIVNDAKSKIPPIPSDIPSESVEPYKQEKKIFNTLKSICEEEVFARGKRNFIIDNFTSFVLNETSTELYIGSYCKDSNLYSEIVYSIANEVNADDILTSILNTTFSLNVVTVNFYAIDNTFEIDKQEAFKNVFTEKYSGITYNFGEFKGFSGVGIDETNELLHVLHNVYLDESTSINETQACVKIIQKDNSCYYNFMRYLFTHY